MQYVHLLSDGVWNRFDADFNLMVRVYYRWFIEEVIPPDFYFMKVLLTPLIPKLLVEALDV